MTFSSIALVICMCEVSVSGSAATSLRKLGSPQDTKPAGAFFETHLRRFFGSSPILASALRFSDSCSGACTTTVPAVS